MCIVNSSIRPHKKFVWLPSIVLRGLFLFLHATYSAKITQTTTKPSVDNTITTLVCLFFLEPYSEVVGPLIQMFIAIDI